MKYKKSIKFQMWWRLPNKVDINKTDYVFDVPKGCTPHFYSWIAMCTKVPYKIHSTINRLKGKKNTSKRINDQENEILRIA